MLSCLRPHPCAHCCTLATCNQAKAKAKAKAKVQPHQGKWGVSSQPTSQGWWERMKWELEEAGNHSKLSGCLGGWGSRRRQQARPAPGLRHSKERVSVVSHARKRQAAAKPSKLNSPMRIPGDARLCGRETDGASVG